MRWVASCRFKGALVVALLLIGMLPVLSSELATVAVSRRDVVDWRAFDGLVEAVTRSTVTAQTSGTVTALHVDVHDFVPADELIVEIDDTVQRAEVESARAALAEAEATLSDARARYLRMRDLLDREAVAQSEFDRVAAAYHAAQARVKAAEASLRQAEQQLDYTRIRAPYPGVVVARHVERGESVRPGSPLMTGLSLERLRVSVHVPQRFAEAVRECSSAIVSLPDGQLLESRALTFFPVADEATHDFEVRVNLPAGKHGLYPGMAIEVRLPQGRRSALLVPHASVLYRSELRAVYVIGEDGGPRLRQVRLGPRRDDEVEILAGLSTGERIAVDPVAAMAVVAGKANDE
ncbi:efflux RND transporter periplasmic adaptor subunit [Arhodomonas sp. AD133]|uniref:efflux RND transporter periplasmic adaptor subunit n=1 Tax=Arhodomonas sp. AD133 TaxID=3415009 RepID=UPI003EBA6921